MARFRKIDPRIWNDAKFRALSDHGKLAFLMLLTHPSMTSLGAMRGTIGGLAEELGWSAEAFREAFQEAFSKGMVEHDQKACLIAVPNFVKYNAPESPNVVKAWLGALDLLPECDLKTRVVARAKGFAEGMGKGFLEAFSEAFGKAMPNKEPEPEPIKEMSGRPDAAAELLDYLNTQAGRNFRTVKATLKPIQDRLATASPEQIRAVIDDRVKAWKGDPKMAEYLRPATLFSASKFESYLGNLGAADTNGAQAPWAGGI